MKKQIITIVISLLLVSMVNAQLRVASNGKVGITMPTSQMPQAALDLGTAQYYAGAPLFLMYNNDPSPLGGIKMGFYADNFGVGLNLNLVFPEDAGVNKGLFTICGKPTSGTALNRYFSIEGMTGNVGIGSTSFLTNTRLYVKNGTTTATNGSWIYSLYANSTVDVLNSTNYIIGMRGVAYNATAINNSGKAFGVSGTAGNIGDGFNYGVFGQITGSKSGAGIFGTSSADCFVNGQYAGFFNGDTKIIGHLWLNNLEITSDKRAKKEIVNLDSNNVSKLKSITAIHFKYKSPKEMSNLIKNIPDTITDSVLYKNLYETVQIGIIAQDVQKVYPELVQTDQNGILAVNYIGFIPILIESIKEQQKTIDNKNESINAQNALLDKLQRQLDDLQDIVTNCCNSKGNSKLKSNIESDIESIDSPAIIANQTTTAKLFQNAPNPFKESTTIKLEIPQTVSSAMVCIYDLNGRQLKCLYVSGRGLTSVQVFGNELSAGMYHYALIADGSLIETKTMILTE